MVKLDTFRKIIYKNKGYAVINAEYKGKKVPIIVDFHILSNLQMLNKSWIINERGAVMTQHRIGDREVDIYMHDLVMKLVNRENHRPTPIIHINRLGIDNRVENLRYDTYDKDVNKNLKKKRRTIIFPKSEGIDVSKIPTYIWYLKSDASHGDRFVVDIGDVSWKTTGSNSVSLKYKLEEAKKYLRFLKRTRSDLFDEFSMNGDYNKEGISMLESFYDIAKKAGYTDLKEIHKVKKTDIYLEEDTTKLTEFEKYLLEEFKPTENRPDINKEYDNFKRFIESKLPEGAIYHPGDNCTGDSIQIGRWRSSTSRSVTFREKIDQLIKYLSF